MIFIYFFFFFLNASKAKEKTLFPEGSWNRKSYSIHARRSSSRGRSSVRFRRILEIDIRDSRFWPLRFVNRLLILLRGDEIKKRSFNSRHEKEEGRGWGEESPRRFSSREAPSHSSLLPAINFSFRLFFPWRAEYA